MTIDIQVILVWLRAGPGEAASTCHHGDSDGKSHQGIPSTLPASTPSTLVGAEQDELLHIPVHSPNSASLEKPAKAPPCSFPTETVAAEVILPPQVTQGPVLTQDPKGEHQGQQ